MCVMKCYMQLIIELLHAVQKKSKSKKLEAKTKVNGRCMRFHCILSGY